MKKKQKIKVSRKSSRQNKAAEPKLPDLVTVMTKLVERLESLEKKTDLVISRVSALPSEVRHVCQDIQGLTSSHHLQLSQTSGHSSQQNHGLANDRKERILYKAVCADCFKNCEVPFKPSGGRPVYCPECWAIRKAGHKPQNPDMMSAPMSKRKIPGPTIQTLPEEATKKSKKVGKKSKKTKKKK